MFTLINITKDRSLILTLFILGCILYSAPLLYPYFRQNGLEQYLLPNNLTIYDFFYNKIYYISENFPDGRIFSLVLNYVLYKLKLTSTTTILLSILVLVISSIVTIRVILGNNNKLLFLGSGLLLCNFTFLSTAHWWPFTLLYSSFIILLCSLSIVLIKSNRVVSKLTAVLLLFIGLGIYQASILLFIAFTCIVVIKKILDKELTTIKAITRFASSYVITTLLAGIIYLIFLKLFFSGSLHMRGAGQQLFSVYALISDFKFFVDNYLLKLAFVTAGGFKYYYSWLLVIFLVLAFFKVKNIKLYFYVLVIALFAVLILFLPSFLQIIGTPVQIFTFFIVAVLLFLLGYSYYDYKPYNGFFVAFMVISIVLNINYATKLLHSYQNRYYTALVIINDLEKQALKFNNYQKTHLLIYGAPQEYFAKEPQLYFMYYQPHNNSLITDKLLKVDTLYTFIDTTKQHNPKYLAATCGSMLVYKIFNKEEEKEIMAHIDSLKSKKDYYPKAGYMFKYKDYIIAVMSDKIIYNYYI